MPDHFSTKDGKYFAASGRSPLFLAAARLRRNVFIELIPAAGVIMIVAAPGILPPANR